ncbi:MAG TPA: tetratricopeptide repeat protein [Anaerolineales bacterium]|nr:tetratricopeptide repeat protein [Anaerolineales bacterium]
MDYSFGNWVKRRRKALDLTQQELAERVGCSVSAILKIEADERRPSRQIAELLAQHLEIPAEQTDLFLKVARKEKAVDSLGEIAGLSQPILNSGSHIPSSPGLLMGRDMELAEITHLIQEPHCRLLTLTGQGGIGKTHLAKHVALLLADSDRHPVVFVGLAPIIGREQTVTAIADALGIVLYTASDRSRQLISYLHNRELLLILDNFEHLAGDAACIDLIDDILQGTHEIKVIATSREPLKLQTEWVFEVQGLPVPKGDRPDELVSSSAVALFIQRANQASVGFNPTRNDLSAIAHICQLVEGLPLGIELASSWVRTLTCDEIAKEIQQSLDFLKTSARVLPERHRSMRATIEHSWKLLTSEEQKVLRQLSIFRGGFNRQGAAAVANASLSDLESLISKSLVRRTEHGRYDMHELIHQYALDQLKQHVSEYDELQIRHSRYFANLLNERGPSLKGAERPVVVTELISDLANFRQAWHWASGHGRARELSLSADTLFWLYESRSNCREGVPLYRQAVQGLQVDEKKLAASEKWAQQLALGQALTYEGFFLFRQGQQPQGREALKSALTILEKIPEKGSSEVQMALSNVIVFLGTVVSVMGDFEEGDRLLQQGLKLKQRLDDPWGSAFCLRQIALSAYYRGDLASSSRALDESLAISQKMCNTWAIAASLSQLGLVAYYQGNYDQAQEYLSEALELSRMLEDRFNIATAMDGLGLVKTAQGQYEDAQSLLQESIALLKEIGEQGSLAQTLNHMGAALLKAGDNAGARRHFLDALSIAREMQTLPVLLDALLGEAEVQALDGAAESALEIVMAVRQNSSSALATRTRAEQLRSTLGSQLPMQRVKSIKAKIAQKTMDSLVVEILSAAKAVL